MGLHDRDYWREHQRRQHRSSFRPRALPALLLWLGVLVAVGIAAKVWQEWKRTEPFPMTGQVHWFTDHEKGPLAMLTFRAPPTGSVNFAVELDDWESHRPVAMVPVRAGETATVQMPLGRYRMTIRKGMAWQGPSRMFAFGSDAREAVHPLELYRVENTIMGHRILLESLGGNMETRPGRSQ